MQGKQVTVVGMARSGVAAANLALRKGARVTCVDLRPDAPQVEGTVAHYGPHRREDFLGADLIVVSPGVPAAQPDLVAAVQAGVPVIGELGFAASFLSIPILAVSGTNGKSTATFLLGQILEQGGYHPFVGGNLGIPLSEGVDGPFDIAAVEVSSYQMELPGEFHPQAAAILNLTPDHLERHRTMDNYGAHKCRLFQQMGPEDAQILPSRDFRLMGLAELMPGRRIYLGGAPGIRVEDGTLILEGVPDEGSLDLGDFALPGLHNQENLAAAVLLANHMGVRREQIRVGALRGLPHRLEPVAERNGVRWINDSKATNVDSTLVALAATTRPAVVLLGGKGKAGAPYSQLAAPLKASRAVICFGEEGPKIAAALQNQGLNLRTVPSLRAAVVQADSLAQTGDVVLLSPACASFDEFSNFEHRGAAFRELVQGL